MPGIVDDDIDTAKAFFRFVEKRGDFRRNGNIGLYGHSLPARGPDFLDDSFGVSGAAGDSRPAHFAREDQLHLFGSAQIDILPDDFLKKIAPAPCPVPNLGQGELGLQHRESVAKAGRRSFLERGAAD